MSLVIEVQHSKNELILSEEEATIVLDIIKKGNNKAKVIQRCHILRLSALGKTANSITLLLEVSMPTIYRIRKQFREDGLNSALNDRKKSGRPSKVTKRIQGQVIALHCTLPPKGRIKWTNLLLHEEGRLQFGWEFSLSTFARISREFDLKPWKMSMWCIPELTPEYFRSMYNVLDVYNEVYDPQRPVYCFDEKTISIIAHITDPLPQNLKHEAREDYHYAHIGVLNIFVMVEPKTGQRYIQITKQRRKIDFAYTIKFLSEQVYQDNRVQKLRIVLDNLNTHFSGSLEEYLPSDEATRLLSGIEWIHTPIHASWLNMAEIEIGVMVRQVLNQRFENFEHLIREIQAWVDTRNAEGTTIDWLFTREEAEKIFDSSKPKITLPDVDIDYEMVVDLKTEIEAKREERKRERKKKSPKSNKRN